MKRIWKTLCHYKRDAVLAPLLKLCEAGMDLLVPVILSLMIDKGITPGNASWIIRAGVILIALAAVGLLFSVSAQYFAARAAVGVSTRLRDALFSHVQRLSYRQLDQSGTSTLITRMTNDVNQIQSGLNLALRLLLRSPFIVFGSMIMAAVLDVNTLWLFGGMILCLSAVVFGIMLKTMPMHKAVQSCTDKVTGAVREDLSGVRVLRAFGLEGQESERFDEVNRRLTEMELVTGRISAFLNPVTYLVVNVSLIVLLATGAVRVGSSVITQGTLVALVNYLMQILTELVKLANLIVSITKAIAAGNRVESVMAIECDPETGAKEITGGIGLEFRNVSMRYPGAGEDAVHDISFRVEPGMLVGVIGGTGSGKSTVASLAAGFYRPTEGNVLLNGVDASEYATASMRRHIHVVPQKAVLFSGTVEGNLLWGNADADKEEVEAALRDAAILDTVASWPEGTGRSVEEGGTNFSGGQRQRLSIARALVGQPDMLILDDSTSALDFATEKQVIDSICGTISGKKNRPTVLLISQRIGTVKKADRILVLDDGAFAGFGTDSELRRTSEVYREICRSQEGGDRA